MDVQNLTIPQLAKITRERCSRLHFQYLPSQCLPSQRPAWRSPFTDSPLTFFNPEEPMFKKPLYKRFTS